MVWYSTLRTMCDVLNKIWLLTHSIIYLKFYRLFCLLLLLARSRSLNSTVVVFWFFFLHALKKKSDVCLGYSSKNTYGILCSLLMHKKKVIVECHIYEHVKLTYILWWLLVTQREGGLGVVYIGKQIHSAIAPKLVNKTLQGFIKLVMNEWIKIELKSESFEWWARGRPRDEWSKKMRVWKVKKNWYSSICKMCVLFSWLMSFSYAISFVDRSSSNKQTNKHAHLHVRPSINLLGWILLLFFYHVIVCAIHK